VSRGEHVVDPDEQSEESNHHRRGRDRLVAKIGFRANTGRTSEKIPNDGKDQDVDLGGGRKNQNRFCHKSAEPPSAVSKKCVPKCRSSSSIVTAPRSLESR